MNEITMKATGRGTTKMFVADTMLRHELCPEGMAHYITVPKNAKSVTLVTRKTETANSFDITSEGRLKDVGRSFDSDLYRWLRLQYTKGDRYAQVEFPA